MLRKTINILAGRNKSIDKVITFGETIDLLENLDDSVKSRLEYIHGVKGYVQHNLSPNEVIKFIEQSFTPFNEGCLDIKHEVFRGTFKEKHYLDLVKDSGDLEVRKKENGENEYRLNALCMACSQKCGDDHMQFKSKAKISYLVDHNFLSPIVNPLTINPSMA